MRVSARTIAITKINQMNVNMRFFKLMGAEVPIVFNAGAISKWLTQINKTEVDIIKTISAMNDHEISQLIYTGMEYGYGMQGIGRCPYTFYEVEEYLLETMQPDSKREFEDLLIFAMECVTGRVDRIAKKNGIDLDMASLAKTMRTNWEEMEQTEVQEEMEKPQTEVQEEKTA